MELLKMLTNAENESKRAHREHMAGITAIVSLIVAVLVLIAFLCGLFLYYGKSELLEKIIALILGFLGGGLSLGPAGFLFGRWSASRSRNSTVE